MTETIENRERMRRIAKKKTDLVLSLEEVYLLSRRLEPREVHMGGTTPRSRGTVAVVKKIENHIAANRGEVRKISTRLVGRVWSKPSNHGRKGRQGLKSAKCKGGMTRWQATDLVANVQKAGVSRPNRIRKFAQTRVHMQEIV